MARVRMSWGWVGSYPIFVYTTAINQGVFKVKVVKGKEGKQNAPGYGPTAPAWKEYFCYDYEARKDVVKEALRKADEWLKEENGRRVHAVKKFKGA